MLVCTGNVVVRFGDVVVYDYRNNRNTTTLAQWAKRVVIQGENLHYTDIFDRAVAQGLNRSNATSMRRAINACPDFQRVDNGTYSLV